MGAQNNPFRGQVPDFAYTDKGSTRAPRDWDARGAARPQCRVCSVAMGRGYVYIQSDAEDSRVQNRYGDENYCSVRCLKRRLNGLPDDDERAMNVLLSRVEVAEREAKAEQERSAAHVANLQLIRAALASLLQTAPGLALGTVHPPGGLLARQVAALQSAVGQHVSLVKTSS